MPEPAIALPAYSTPPAWVPCIRCGASAHGAGHPAGHGQRCQSCEHGSGCARCGSREACACALWDYCPTHGEAIDEPGCEPCIVRATIRGGRVPHSHANAVAFALRRHLEARTSWRTAFVSICGGMEGFACWRVYRCEDVEWQGEPLVLSHGCCAEDHARYEAAKDAEEAA